MIHKQLIAAYLDYFNNYISVEKFAEHNQLTPMQAVKIIHLGQELDLQQFKQEINHES